MSDSGDGLKYKWSPESTALLVSVWSDRQVQKQLEYASKPQLIWESVARYMKKKGYNVSGKQCRSRMKQVLVCYREAKRAGTRAGVEQYYESIDRVLKNKRFEDNNLNGIDTVDANVKSPPKEVKTSKNLQMRHKFQEPVQSLYRTEALSPTWVVGRENEYPDSPESNETIIAQPYRMLSPTRDVGINTGDQLAQIAGRSVRCNNFPREEVLHANYKQNLIGNYPYGEVPFQNAVQNVQNQIIQENMQQHQNLQQNQLWNQHNLLTNNLGFQHNLHNINQGVTTQTVNVPIQTNVMSMQNPSIENYMQQQNQLQKAIHINNQAMPQEPRKIVFGQNLAATYKQQRDMFTHMNAMAEVKQKTGSLSPDYSPDVSQNLNDAFCQSTKSSDKSHNLNETFNQPRHIINPSMMPNPDVSVITNNATCNDDSVLLEFLVDSPTPSENENKSRDTAINTDNIPHVPARKKKAQKLEQLVLSAISSQNEVVNKILAAQNDMVARFLNVDRDRQNRLENRLDDLLKIVHGSGINKQTDDEFPSPPTEPMITSLAPPPRPGVIPPKLDLVPPKPCRVPCTMPNANIELINQNPLLTRPGVISPITSPSRKPGSIFSKLGPVSQSPFVKAQQRLGFQPILTSDTRTQSSAERRIIKEIESVGMNTKALIFETKKFLEMERQLEESIENARLEMNRETLQARRRLFPQRETTSLAQKEPTVAMILTAAFLDNECRVAEQAAKRFHVLNIDNRNCKEIKQHDDLLAGQGESYERLRELKVQSNYLAGEPCESSTPAKLGEKTGVAPKQTIQQLAQLVMNSGRWKDSAAQNHQHQHQNQNHQRQYQNQNLERPIQPNLQSNRNGQSAYNGVFSAPRSSIFSNPQTEFGATEKSDQAPDWISRKYGNTAMDQRAFNEQNNTSPQKPKFPMGFTTVMLDAENAKKIESNGDVPRSIGFNNNVISDRKQQNVRFMDDALAELLRMHMERISEEQQEKNDSLPFVIENGNPISSLNIQIIERYIREMLSRKQLRDNKGKDTDSDNEEEFLDTTATMPTSVVPRRGSLTSTGTASTETAYSMKLTKHNCVIS